VWPPLFYLLSLPFIALAAWQGDLNWPTTVATFLFWPAAGREIVSPYLSVGWTLCFEMIFYSAVAAVLIGGRLRRNLAILGVAAVALTVARSLSDWNPLRILANPIFLEFGAGAALAVIWPRLRQAHLALGAAFIALALGVFGAEAIVGVGDEISSRVAALDAGLRCVWMFGPPATMLVAGAAICDRALRGPLVAALAWLGDASYSIYLSQEIAIRFFMVAWLAAIGGAHAIVGGGVVFVASVVLGAAIYILVERPVMRAVRRLPIGRRAAPPPNAARASQE